MPAQSSPHSSPQSPPSRRTVLGGLAGAGLSLPALAACGSGGSGSSRPGSASGSQAAVAKGGVLAKTSQIPVGGGKVFAAEQVVVTQPKRDEFKCFTAVCPHQGCLVSKVVDDEIDCTCHGSRFSATDGSVINGPATQPLAEKQIDVKGNSITLR